jgi:hypothetical protein
MSSPEAHKARPAQLAQAAIGATRFHDEAMRRAREIVPILRERARRAEDERMLIRENEQMLHVSGFFRIHQPKVFGGMELGFAAIVDIPAELGRGCPSTAWNVGNLASHRGRAPSLHCRHAAPCPSPIGCSAITIRRRSTKFGTPTRTRSSPRRWLLRPDVRARPKAASSSTAAGHSRRVSMAMRWTAAAMQEAAKGFRRLKAHKQLPVLRVALEAHQNKNARGVLARQANAA